MVHGFGIRYAGKRRDFKVTKYAHTHHASLQPNIYIQSLYKN